MSDNRTIRELSRLDGRVYVYLADEAAGRRFLAAAEAEGFAFPDGAAPTQRHAAQIMAFGAGVERMGASPLLRVDFQRYAAGEQHYLL